MPLWHQKMEFELGSLYRLKLVEKLDESAESNDLVKYSGHKILFDRNILKGDEEVIFVVKSEYYTITRTMTRKDGIIEKISDIQYVTEPSHFENGGILYFPSFELIPGKFDIISVDCSSWQCRNPHLVKCKITAFTSEEQKKYTEELLELEEKLKQQTIAEEEIVTIQ
jgi:hypothetical protein